MNPTNLDFQSINKIIKKITSEMGNSRNYILEIVQNIRSEQEKLKNDLLSLQKETKEVIQEVDDLEKKDKLMRKKLARVSRDFHKHSEGDIKAAYEAASQTRIDYVIKQNKEKELKKRRNDLELALKKSSQNIESAERVINQISIALGYLEGDVIAALGDVDQTSEMFVGIKILEAQENERKRIARDVHDGPAQYMANASMKVDVCKVMLQRDLDSGLEELGELKESIALALKEVRGIIFNLSPMSLEDLGLNETIKEAVKSIILQSGIHINLKLKPLNEEVEHIIQVAVYRIVQEVFNNMIKHAKAKKAEVKLDYGTKYLRLVISDDGVGFDVEETLDRVKSSETSYGLIGIYDRVDQLQGTVNIESTLGQGTVYTVKLPINRGVIRDESEGN
ncbi:sensor histidine kinase [Isachenkonia alkalipeptolytica]|uniref:histidine kinase n=1 Tax=Isachenkonia alkalipeptolytica TaxID=2565777 RepID=A0AA43XJE4_9CLOT|nr:sensor histidine kinase [Isachenkonia alkalipeptolytica]NBG87953.1 sensor histidine kinase [Isachenkonia alkalipeptolytica]